MKIKLEVGSGSRSKTVIEIGWIHIIFFGIVLFLGFCLLAAGVLSL